MSIGNITDALSRVSAIEQQLAQLQSGTLLDSALGVSGGSGSTSSSTGSSGTSSANFANALAQAGSGSTAATGSTDAATASSESTLLSELLNASGASSGGVSVAAPVSAAASTTGSATLPAAATAELTSAQQQFASTLSAATGLSPAVVSAWLLSEESGGAAQSRQAQGNNDWLNIGYTDSATYGSSDSVWSDPVTAATATAQWLQGQDSIPGYGTASSGVQSILQSVGQAPAQQIQAIQGSGWASSGYPALASLYSQVTGA